MRLLAAALLAVASCSGASKGADEGLPSNRPPPEPGPPAPRADAAFGVVFYPATWTELTEKIRGVARRLGVPVDGDLAELLAPPDAFAPLGAIANELGLENRIDRAPPGIDAYRPIVASLFIPLSSPLEAAAILARRSGGAWMFAHQIIVPATDAERLAPWLEKALAPANEEVRVTPRGAVVEVAIFGRLGAPAAEPTLPAAPAAPGTAADRLLAAPGSVIARAVVRRRPLRAVTPLLGIYMTARAMVTMSGDVAPRRLLAAGIGESLTGLLVQDPRGALAGDVAFELPVDGPIRVELAAALTPAGKRAFAAGGVGDAPRDVLDVDHVAVAEKAPSSPLFAKKSAEAVSEAMLMCGAGCMIYASMGNAYGLLHPILGDPEITGGLAETVREARALRPAGLRADLALRGNALVGRAGFGEDSRVFDATDLASGAPATAGGDDSACALGVIEVLARGLRAVGTGGDKDSKAALGALRAARELSCEAPEAAAAKELLGALAGD